jgi:hypothetical protein
MASVRGSGKLDSVRRRSSLRLAALVVVGFLGAVFVGANSADASGEPPAGYAAVVGGIEGRAGWIPMSQFEKRKTQVRAERRVAGGNDRSSVGEESLWQLLEEVEVEAEALQIGIRVDSRRVAREFRRVKHRDFSSIGQFQAFLKRIHLTEDEARHRIKVQLLFGRIEDHVLAGVSPHKKSIALQRFSYAYLRRWRSRTICRPALATERCSNGAPLSMGTAGFAGGPVPRKGGPPASPLLSGALVSAHPSQPGSGRINNSGAICCCSTWCVPAPSASTS